MARSRSSKTNGISAANIGFEAKLWLAADKLRSNMDAAEYKHTVLGLIFLKCISDSFEELHAKLVQGSAINATPARSSRAGIGDAADSSLDQCFGANPRISTRQT